MKAIKPFLLAALTGLLISLSNADSRADTVLDQKEAARSLELRDVKATPSSVSGEIVNRTPHIVRDTELLIQFHWLWKNEFKPGSESPGRTDTLKIAKELKAGESTAFRYTPDPPLSKRSDGWFEPEVRIGGFTVVTPGTEMTSR